MKIACEKEEKNLSELRDYYTNMKENLTKMEKKIGELRSQVGIISKLFLQTQKTRVTIQREIEQKITQCNIILNECKVCKLLNETSLILFI